MIRQIWKLNGQYILFFLFSCSLYFLGFASGTLYEKVQEAKSAPGFSLSSCPDQEIPFIHFQKIENGFLIGESTGREARVIVGEGKRKEVFPIFSGEFSISVIEILPNIAFIPAPEGMYFVASKRGKTFWPLDAPEAALITPKNRIFFQDEKEAKENGYKKGE